MGPRNDVLSGGPDPLGEGAILGRTSPACGRYTESYTVGGSSGATYRCQYSSNLLFTAKRNTEALLVYRRTGSTKFVDNPYCHYRTLIGSHILLVKRNQRHASLMIGPARNLLLTSTLDMATPTLAAFGYRLRNIFAASFAAEKWPRSCAVRKMECKGLLTAQKLN